MSHSSGNPNASGHEVCAADSGGPGSAFQELLHLDEHLAHPGQLVLRRVRRGVLRLLGLDAVFGKESVAAAPDGVQCGECSGVGAGQGVQVGLGGGDAAVAEAFPDDLDVGAAGARYALLISIETPGVDVDIWTPVAAQISVPVEVML